MSENFVSHLKNLELSALAVLFQGNEMEETIPKTRTAPSSTTLRLQYFLGGTLKFDPAFGRAIVRLDEWASMFLDSAAKIVAANSGNSKTGAHYINGLAESLTRDESGLARELLQKSLQETLIYSAGPASQMGEADVEARLLRFIRVRGPAGLVRRFLSFHLFNVVWFQTADAFRGLARNQQTFLEDMERLEQMCRRTVTSVCKTHRFNGGLHLSTAEQLVGKIERRLMGV
jgi:hypothetical protein